MTGLVRGVVIYTLRWAGRTAEKNKRLDSSAMYERDVQYTMNEHVVVFGRSRF